MKVTLWTFLKVVLISFLSIGVITYRVDSFEDARGMGTALALGFGFVAVFQLVLWFFYDIVTLRRGGWRVPCFHQNPFTTHQGPGLHLTVTAVVLIVFGILKTLSGSFYDLPSVVLGGWLVAIGGFVLAWQKMLGRIFSSRFADNNGNPSGAANTAPPHR